MWAAITSCLPAVAAGPARKADFPIPTGPATRWRPDPSGGGTHPSAADRSAGPVRATNRWPVTWWTVTGSGTPLREHRGVARTRSPASRPTESPMASEITTRPGAASAWIRAARLTSNPVVRGRIVGPAMRHRTVPVWRPTRSSAARRRPGASAARERLAASAASSPSLRSPQRIRAPSPWCWSTTPPWVSTRRPTRPWNADSTSSWSSRAYRPAMPVDPPKAIVTMRRRAPPSSAGATGWPHRPKKQPSPGTAEPQPGQALGSARASVHTAQPGPGLRGLPDPPRVRRAGHGPRAPDAERTGQSLLGMGRERARRSSIAWKNHPAPIAGGPSTWSRRGWRKGERAPSAVRR